ncbi:hypothetical protein MCOR25_006024 [Pyricularia grisea]|uniref:Uncharacterized protein n=1 Tax=Pyricularia grisea TaxID=148305 RepID=A0A6P8BHG7_PYRGI|nr:uncharacterized protein PgNI_01681 [Pyricularia grisea]KAI6363080.1 hypothetical protein MCOR25_006024 [Pyricularia grisea]TLD16213.1 hypothetical protein PgNI_01681 [Pyricularia grisea]
MIDKASRLLQKEWQAYELRMLDRAHGRSKSPGAEWQRQSTKASTSSTSGSSKQDHDPMLSESRLGVSEVAALDSAADVPLPSIEIDASFDLELLPKKSQEHSQGHSHNTVYHQWSDLPENIRLCIMKLMSGHVGAIWEAQRLLMLDFAEIQDFESLYIRERNKCLGYTEAVMKGLESKEALVETLRRAGREASADIELLRSEQAEEYSLVIDKVTSEDVIAGKTFLQNIGLSDFGVMLEGFEGVSTGPMFEIEFQLSGEVGVQPFQFELDWNLTVEEGLICSRANTEARQKPVSHGWMHLKRDQDELNPNVNPVHLHYSSLSLKKSMSRGTDIERRRQNNRPHEPVGGNLQHKPLKNQPGVSSFSRLTPVSNSSSDDVSKGATLKRSDKREGMVMQQSAVTMRTDDVDGALKTLDKKHNGMPIITATAPPVSTQHPTTPTKIVLKTSVGRGKRDAPEELSGPQKKVRITQGQVVKQSRSAGLECQDKQHKNQNQPNAIVKAVSREAEVPPTINAARLKRAADPVPKPTIQRELQA